MKYEVVFEPFTERHYIRTFAKKYKGAWDLTLSLIQEEFEQIDLLFVRNIAETIVDGKEIKICKTEFRVHGTEESRHSSGNRCIVAVHKNIFTVNILLVYSKTDLSGGNETANWKNLIRENYPEYSKIV